MRRRGIRVTSGLNEVEACMNAVVNNFGAVNTVLLFEVRVEARLNVLNNRLPAVGHGVNKRRVGQAGKED